MRTATSKNSEREDGTGTVSARRYWEKELEGRKERDGWRRNEREGDGWKGRIGIDREGDGGRGSEIRGERWGE